MRHSPLFHTAQSRHCPGAPTCRIWCRYLKVSLNRRTPRQKHYPPPARAAYTPQERYPQWILSWCSMCVNCEFGVVGAPRLTCRCVRIFLASLYGAARATCHVLLIDPKSAPSSFRRIGESSGDLPVTIGKAVLALFIKGLGHTNYISQTIHKCRSQTPSNPPTAHRLQ